MATTYTTFLSAWKPKKEWVFSPTHKLVRVAVNFATQALDAGLSDVHQVISVPPNCMVLRCWPVVTTAGPTNGTFDLGYGSDVDYWGNAIALDNTGCNTILVANSAARTTSALADGASETTAAITVDGAALGDVTQQGFSASTTLVTAGGNLINLTSAVTAANAARIVMDNEAGANIDPVGTFTVYVDKAPRARNPIVLSASAVDTIDIVATTDTADVNLTSGIVEIWAELLLLSGTF